MGRKGHQPRFACFGVHVFWPLLGLCALAVMYLAYLESGIMQTAGDTHHDFAPKLVPSNAAETKDNTITPVKAIPATAVDGGANLRKDAAAKSLLQPAAEIAAGNLAAQELAASPKPAEEGAVIVPPQEIAAPPPAAPVSVDALPALVARGLSKSAKADFSQALAVAFAGKDDSPENPAVTTPEPRALQPNDFLSMIRIQKTASKTLQGILMWLAADAFSRGNKHSTRNRCACNFFSTSDVPLATELQKALEEAGEGEANAILASPFEAHKDKLTPPPVDKGGWPADLGSKWYKGAPLPGRKTRACASFDEPQKSVRGTHCPFLHAQHMHIADVEGGLAQFKGLGVDRVRLVAAVRHPSRRVQSEFKHVANHGPGLWDYCHVAERQKLQGGYRHGTFGGPTLTDFLAADAHAFGMRNRQVKMISGLATEPVRQLPASSWAGYPGDSSGRGIIKQEHHQEVGQPSKAYQEWAADALALAKWRLATMEGVLVAERLAESLAVLMVHFSWIPLLGDTTPDTPRGAVEQPSNVEQLRALIQKRQDTPKEFKRPDLHVLTLGLERQGVNLDYTVHVDWSQCEQRFERVHSSAEKWSSKLAQGARRVQQEGGAAEGVEGGVQSEAGQGSTAGDAQQGEGGDAEPVADKGPGKLPETAAGLTAWDMLVCVSSHMADQFREMDRTDKLKLGFEVEGQLEDRLLSLNELDTALHAYALELLDARVEHAKSWLGVHDTWIKEAMQWGNKDKIPANPIPIAKAA